MKKVFYVYGNLPAYRKEFFARLSQTLADEGIELQVLHGQITNKATRQDDSTGYVKHSFPTRFYQSRWLRISRLIGLASYVRHHRPDAIVFQFNQSNLSYWNVLLHCLVRHIPYGIWGCNYTRSDLNPRLAQWRENIYGRLYRSAAVLIPYGTLYRQHMLEVGASPDNIFVAQNTIDVESIARQHPAGLRQKSPHAGLKILFVGAIAPQKRIETAVEAVSKLLDEGLDLRLDIVGGGDSTRLQAMLCDMCDEKRRRIVIHGPKYGSELTKFFLESDVFLMPGTGGLGVNEAMAYGLPIISTHGDETVYDLISDNGILLKNFGDVEEQASALRAFAVLSAAERTEMGLRSQQIILSKASLRNMVMCHARAIGHALRMNIQFDYDTIEYRGGTNILPPPQRLLRGRGVQGMGPVRRAEFPRVSGAAGAQKVGAVQAHRHPGVQTLPLQPAQARPGA